MVVNFRARSISRNTPKLVRAPTLTKLKKIKERRRSQFCLYTDKNKGESHPFNHLDIEKGKRKLSMKYQSLRASSAARKLKRIQRKNFLPYLYRRCAYTIVLKFKILL